MSYPTKKLGEVCEIKKGRKPELFDVQTKTRFPYLEAKFLRGTKEAKFAEKSDKNSVPVNKGDLIIICDGSKSGDVFSGFEGILSSTMGRIDFDKERAEKMYLELFLKVNFDLFNSSKKGAAIPHLDFNIFNNLEIPLPPLAEQKKIVARLEGLLGKIKEAKRLRAESETAAQNLLPSELHRIFTQPIRQAQSKQHSHILKNVGMSDSPSKNKRWEEKELGEIATLVRGPFGGSLRKDTFVETGNCVYEQGNVIGGDLENFRYFIIPEKFNQMKRFAVSAGDILMSCSGTIGRFVIVMGKFKKGIINQALLKITPSQKITSEFLKFTLENYFSSNNTHVKGMAIKNIAAVKELKKIKIPLPPLAEQKKIVARLDSLSEKIKKLRDYQAQTRSDFTALEQSVLSKSFQHS